MTEPECTGFVDGDTANGPAKVIDGASKYSWVKSPRYDGNATEVGPLSCLLVNYAKGNKKKRSTPSSGAPACRSKRSLRPWAGRQRGCCRPG